MEQATQGWSAYWEQEGAGGEVFVNAQGRKHPALAEFWADVFEALVPGARVIDIASGAGSIYAHLPADHGLDLAAADISGEALEALKGRIPGTRTFVCPAEAVPAEDESFELVVSQFGIEYAGRDAFSEAGRLVAPGGHLAALVHVRGGYVDSNNKAQLGEAGLVEASGFIDLCVEVTKAGFSKDIVRMQKAEEAFLPAAKQIDAAVGRCKHGVHVHLMAGFMRLFQERRKYAESDITEWLEGMRAEVRQAVERLSHMRTAAMSAEDMQYIGDRLEAAGLSQIAFNEFTTPGNDKAVAWSLVAARPPV